MEEALATAVRLSPGEALEETEAQPRALEERQAELLSAGF